MRNKISKYAFVLALTATSIFTSCSSDDDSSSNLHTITVDLTEVGSGNNMQATAGEDLHLEAAILATGRIASVVVEIHSETNSNAPEIIQNFASYNGLLNATFHEHLDIPAAQPAGNYHLHLTVTDQEGNIKTAETDLEIIEGSPLFTANITEFGHGTPGSFHGHPGQDLHIEGVITSVNPIATIAISMHHETNASAPEINANYTDYAGQTNVNFHKHLLIPANQPLGDYHVHLTVTDNQGNSKTFDYEFVIE